MGFISGSSLRRGLNIPSLPGLSQGTEFWRGLRIFCETTAIWRVQIDTFCSPCSPIPPLPGEISRRQRIEFVLSLQGNPLAGLSSNHRRNLARAKKAGLSLIRTRQTSACDEHLRLMKASMERRAKNGESVPLELDAALPRALLSSSLGELFQVTDGSRILSSLLLLRASAGAYYQSAGTLPAGMEVGASPFLIAEVAVTLQREGVRTFNLGGTNPESAGLRRFKEGFGAVGVPLESVCFCPRRFWRRKLYSAARMCVTLARS
ncbi:MAG TPA: GNAT family N-acetyltransferase [Terriglobales bacterium]|nr:GNAT family N-acetyltransferase [Terriglobales bacterium]